MSEKLPNKSEVTGKNIPRSVLWEQVGYKPGPLERAKEKFESWKKRRLAASMGKTAGLGTVEGTKPDFSDTVPVEGQSYDSKVNGHRVSRRQLQEEFAEWEAQQAADQAEADELMAKTPRDNDGVITGMPDWDAHPSDKRADAPVQIPVKKDYRLEK